jgi:hypothetical protein
MLISVNAIFNSTSCSPMSKFTNILSISNNMNNKSNIHTNITNMNTNTIRNNNIIIANCRTNYHNIFNCYICLTHPHRCAKICLGCSPRAISSPFSLTTLCYSLTYLQSKFLILLYFNARLTMPLTLTSLLNHFMIHLSFSTVSRLHHFISL